MQFTCPRCGRRSDNPCECLLAGEMRARREALRTLVAESQANGTYEDEKAQEPARCQVQILRSGEIIPESCGAAMPCAAHSKGCSFVIVCYANSGDRIRCDSPIFVGDRCAAHPRGEK